MWLVASHSGHRAPGRRNAPPRFASRVRFPYPSDFVTSVLCLGSLYPENSPEVNLRPRFLVLQSAFICGHLRPQQYFHAFWVTIFVMPDCVSSLSLNSQLSTVISDSSAQPPCFHNLLHSSAISQKSALCFHILTNSISRKPLPLIFIQIARGCHPVAGQLSKPIHEPGTHNPISPKHLAQPLASSFRRCLLPSAYC